MSFANFDDRVAFYFATMSPAAQRVVRVLQEARDEVLVASAASLAEKAKTSDATVIRTVKSMGFAGMNELRQLLAAELKQSLTITGRLTGTLQEVGDNLTTAFNATLDIHCEAILNLRRDITPPVFREAVHRIIAAKRIVIFGIGPSSAIAAYFAIQLSRFGINTLCLRNTGLLFADDLRQLHSGDVLIAMAYTHVYRELAVLLDEAGRRKIKTILLTDSLAAKLRRRVDLVLPVDRGRAGTVSMHTATLSLIETLLVGIAAKNSKVVLQSLETLNALRENLVGTAVDIPNGAGKRNPKSGSRSKY